MLRNWRRGGKRSGARRGKVFTSSYWTVRAGEKGEKGYFDARRENVPTKDPVPAERHRKSEAKRSVEKQILLSNTWKR